MLPYRLILALACLVLAARYALDAAASTAGRWVVVAATTVSFLLPAGLGWYVASVATQLSVSLFVLLRRAVVGARP